MKRLHAAVLILGVALVGCHVPPPESAEETNVVAPADPYQGPGGDLKKMSAPAVAPASDGSLGSAASAFPSTTPPTNQGPAAGQSTPESAAPADQ